jgi:Bacteriophage capsid portal protein
MSETTQTVIPIAKAYVRKDLQAAAALQSRALRADSSTVFGQLYEDGVAIRPPFDLGDLTYFLEVNTEHYRCVKQKALDVLKGGYKISEAQQFDEQGDELESNEEHRRVLEAFFGSPNEEQTLFELMDSFLTDFGAIGNAYLEIVRGVQGIATGESELGWPAKMYHLPGKTMRVMKDGEGFVQIRGTKKRFFKNFGDERIIDCRTGKEADETLPLEFRATEVLHLKNYHPKSDWYGVPDWIPAIGAIVGNVNARDYNISFFENSAVPMFAVILEGAAFDDETKDVITNFFQTEIRGTNNAHKTLILEVPPARKDEQPAKITLKELQQQTIDAHFRNYRKDNRDEIIRAHNMPPFRIGIIETASLGTGTGSSQMENYREAVIEPLQQRLAYRFTRLLIQSEAGFGFKDFEFKVQSVHC